MGFFFYSTWDLRQLPILIFEFNKRYQKKKSEKKYGYFSILGAKE